MDNMNNVKLTLATTLSVLALAFSGAASAENGKRFDNHQQKNVIVKTTYVKEKSAKKVNRHQAQNKVAVKRVMVEKAKVKKSPNKKILLTKTKVGKSAKYSRGSKISKRSNVKNKRFAHVNKFNKQYNRYQKRANAKNSYQRVNRVNNNKRVKQATYSVRSGDTLIQISYKTGVSIQKLARLNRIKNRNLNYLQVGQVLRLA